MFKKGIIEEIGKSVAAVVVAVAIYLLALIYSIFVQDVYWEEVRSVSVDGHVVTEIRVNNKSFSDINSIELSCEIESTNRKVRLARGVGTADPDQGWDALVCGEPFVGFKKHESSSKYVEIVASPRNGLSKWSSFSVLVLGMNPDSGRVSNITVSKGSYTLPEKGERSALRALSSSVLLWIIASVLVGLFLLWMYLSSTKVHRKAMASEREQRRKIEGDVELLEKRIEDLQQGKSAKRSLNEATSVQDGGDSDSGVTTKTGDD